jgi:hypothetical protein
VGDRRAPGYRLLESVLKMNGFVCKGMVLRKRENLQNNPESPGMGEIIKINLVIKTDLFGCVMMILNGFPFFPV